MSFPCSCCGLCCQNVGKSIAYADLDRGDGTCRYYDDATHLCRIYAQRPLRCRVDEFYDKFLQNTMTRKEYYEKNIEACQLLKIK